MNWPLLTAIVASVAVVIAASKAIAATAPQSSVPPALPLIPFTQAKHFRAATNRVIKWIVIHDAETPEKPGAAAAVAAYFASVERPASAHYIVDDATIAQSVKDSDVAYAAPPMNDEGLHIELAGYAKQTWTDPYSESMLRLAARLVANRARKYDVPLVWLSADDLKAGKRGITSHANVTAAFHQSDHTDPGPNFPIDHFMDLVRSS